MNCSDSFPGVFPLDLPVSVIASFPTGLNHLCDSDEAREVESPSGTRACASEARAETGPQERETDQPADEVRLAAFVQTAERHRSQLLWLATRITDSRDEAEDIVQHALLKAFVNLSKFRGESQMSTWLGAIVQNTAREFMRGRKGKVFLPLEYAPGQDGESAVHDFPDPAKNPEERLDCKEREEMVRAAVEHLSCPHRRAMQMCMLDELPYLQAASTLNVSLSTVKSRVFRGKQLLKMSLQRRTARSRQAAKTAFAGLV